MEIWYPIDFPLFISFWHLLKSNVSLICLNTGYEFSCFLRVVKAQETWVGRIICFRRVDIWAFQDFDATQGAWPPTESVLQFSWNSNILYVYYLQFHWGFYFIKQSVATIENAANTLTADKKYLAPQGKIPWQLMTHS